jgi:hypothetical protein
MPPDIPAWTSVVRQSVAAIADETLQGRAWFGIGSEISSPDEMFNQFFNDAAIEEFLRRTDNGLNKVELDAGRHLVELMNELADQTPEFIPPASLIDDPRWERIRQAAARFLALLSAEK